MEVNDEPVGEVGGPRRQQRLDSCCCGGGRDARGSSGRAGPRDRTASEELWRQVDSGPYRIRTWRDPLAPTVTNERPQLSGAIIFRTNRHRCDYILADRPIAFGRRLDCRLSGNLISRVWGLACPKS
jgi:hypothetical protein